MAPSFLSERGNDTFLYPCHIHTTRRRPDVAALFSSPQCSPNVRGRVCGRVVFFSTASRVQAPYDARVWDGLHGRVKRPAIQSGEAEILFRLLRLWNKCMIETGLEVAAVVTWVVTAVGALVILLYLWITRGTIFPSLF